MKDFHEMTRLMEAVVARIAHKPVEVVTTESLLTITFDVKPQAVDVGRLVGNRGDMVLSLERVFGRMSEQLGKRVVVNIHKTTERVRDYSNPPHNPQYESESELILLEGMVEFMFNDAAIARETTHMDDHVEFTVACDHNDDGEVRIALNTIFTAIGAKAGARIVVKVEEL